MKRQPGIRPSNSRQYPWILALVVFGFVFCIGAFGIMLLPKTYQSSATILMRPMSDFVLDPNEAAIGGSFQERVNNQLAVLKSDQTAQRAQEQLFEFLQTKQCGLCEQVLPNLTLEPLSIKYTMEKDYSQEIRRHIQVHAQPNSHVTAVSIRSDDDRPEDLKTLLILYLAAFQAESATFGKQLIREQLSAVEEQLKLAHNNQKQAEKTLADFRKTHQTLDPNAQLNAMVMNQAHLKEAIARTDADRAAIQKAKAETQNALSLSVPTIEWVARLVQDDQLTGIRQQIIQVYKEKAQWLSKKGMMNGKQLLFSDIEGDERQEDVNVKDPNIGIKLQTLDEEVRYLNELMQKRIQTLLRAWEKTHKKKPDAKTAKELNSEHVVGISSIDVQLAIRSIEEDIQLAALASRKQALNSAVSSLSGQLKNVPALQLDYAKLHTASKLAADKVELLELQQSRLETVQPNSTVAPLVVLQKPETPTSPISPEYPLLYTFAGILGLLAALLVLVSGKRPERYTAHTQTEAPAHRAYIPMDADSASDSGTVREDELWEDMDIPTYKSKTKPSSKTTKKQSKEKTKKSWWPFQPKARKESPKNRLLPFKSKGDSAAALQREPDSDSSSKTFHLDPLPDLPAFIMQMEGENPYALQTQGLEDFRQFLVKSKQDMHLKRIGVVPVSSFSTAQSTLLALSLLLAESGQKLAVIDLDFSDLSLSRWVSTFPIPLARGLNEGQGASEYIEGLTSDFVDVIYPLGKSVYGSFIPAGHLGGIKDIQLTPDRLEHLNSELSPNYDFVFYALPSIEQNPAALQIGSMLDGVILVSYPGITKPKERDQALRILAQNGISTIAILEQP